MDEYCTGLKYYALRLCICLAFEHLLLVYNGCGVNYKWNISYAVERRTYAPSVLETGTKVFNWEEHLILLSSSLFFVYLITVLGAADFLDIVS